MPRITKTINVRRSRSRVVSMLNEIFRGMSGKSRRYSRYQGVFFGVYAESYYTSVNKAFNVKKAHRADELGNTWPPLKFVTIEKKLAARPNSKVFILIESTRLEKSTRPGRFMRWKYRRYNQDQKYEHKGSSLILGSNVEWAGYHQTGTRRMRARPPFPGNHMRWVIRASRAAFRTVVDRIEEDLK